MSSSFKSIIITLPFFIEGEAAVLTAFCQSFIDAVHLRKPDCTEAQMEALIAAVDPACRNKLVLHSHYVLVKKYGLKGVHLNQNKLAGLDLSDYADVQCSYSAHSLAEIEVLRKRDFAYFFLSPVFDSISKLGYGARIDLDEVAAFCKKHPSQILIALGGVTPEHYSLLKGCGFKGAAYLGYCWQRTN